PLGRRLYKHSNAHHLNRSEAGSQWNRNEQARKQRELGCGFTLFGWDGDTLAWESSPAQADGASGKTVHYLYEPGTFVPVAQALRHQPMRLLAQPSYTGAYDIDQDPLWTHTPQALPIDVLAWYQCDHLGTPQELTDPTGQIAWSAQYKAWGEVKEQRSEWAQRQGLTNPIRFQGQYHDHETGLHYNRYRYYDPRVGRFVSKDPISYAGGLNLYAYAPNPVEWVDPLGLRCDSPAQKLKRKLSALQSAEKSAERIRELPDGRIRYYDKEALARTSGPTRGRSHVTEYNSATGQVRTWEETYDHFGAVNRVHPKMNNGELLDLPHYPPTRSDIDQGIASPSGRAIKKCQCGC
ncbi:RHS repeat-associated core domain-containing protein, partial [Pseudomonas lundensis]|uniref:RHS repeat-associated core domain-containing protein n=1 Tax=Pseudomonas lundensis TaxID=86185 RepID=UPI000641D285